MSGSDSSEETYGPCRPTQMTNTTIIGPLIPSSFDPQCSINIMQKEAEFENKEKSLQKEKDEVKDDGDIIGPLPPTNMSTSTDDDVIRMIEERAEKMKERLLNPGRSEKVVRDDWMLKLPEVGKGRKRAYTVEKKTFDMSSSNMGDSRAERLSRVMWTETPEERDKREARGEGSVGGGEQKEEVGRLKERDEAMMRLVHEHNNVTNRNKTMLEAHKEKIKKKKKHHSSSSSSEDDHKKKHKKKKSAKHSRDAKESCKKDKKRSKVAERRPFDRDLDLNAKTLMTSKAREAIISNSKVLASRFSHGKKSQFL